MARVGDDLLVILRRGRNRARLLGPGLPAIFGAKKAAFAACRLDRGVEDVGIDRRDGQADPPLVAGGKSLVDLPPGRSRIGRAVQSRLGAAVDQGPDMPPPLIGRGIKQVGIPRIEHDVGHAGVGADGQDGLPRLAAVGRLVEPSIAARHPERPLRSDIDDLRVTRVDHDPGDVLRGFQADPGKTRPAINRLVEPVAVPDAPLAVVFASADPDHQVIAGIDGDAADRVRPVTVEDRRPGGSGIRGFPYPAGRGRDVPGAAFDRIDRDVPHPPRH